MHFFLRFFLVFSISISIFDFISSTRFSLCRWVCLLPCSSFRCSQFFTVCVQCICWFGCGCVRVCVYDTLIHFYSVVNLGRSNWNRCKVPEYVVDSSGSNTKTSSSNNKSDSRSSKFHQANVFIFLFGHLFCFALHLSKDSMNSDVHHDAQRGTMKKGSKEAV